MDGSVVWQNIGLGANWLIPFGVDIEPAPTPSDPSRYNIIVGDEGYSMLFRLDEDGNFVFPVPFATESAMSPASMSSRSPRSRMARRFDPTASPQACCHLDHANDTEPGDGPQRDLPVRPGGQCTVFGDAKYVHIDGFHDSFHDGERVDERC